MSEQRCGMCRWWSSTTSTGEWGWCNFEVEPLPFLVPLYCNTGKDASWRDVAAMDGEGCPTWTRTEG